MSADNNPIALLSEQFAQVLSENAELKESMADVRAQLQYEDQGWKLIGDWAAGDHLEGLDLEEVQMVAEKLAPRVAAGALPRRAVDLHSGFVWGRGCWIEGTEKPSGSGRPPAIRTFYTDRTNQASIFSDNARESLQKARFIDGNVLAAVNTRTKKVNIIPFKQITSLRVDPDFPENVLMYKRTWDQKTGKTDSVKSRWYVTTRFEGKRPGYIETDTERIPVDPDITIVDLRANRQVGHVLGIPDGLAGLHWSEAYGQAMKWGMVVSESLAKILFRVTNKTKQGVQNTAVKMSGFGGHGGTASMAEGQELTAVSTAGKGYDFGSNRSLAAMAAAAWNVSNSDLLNDASANGSSYGSAQSLVAGNRNAMLLMQSEWADFYKDIFETLGFNRPSVVFQPFEAPDKYREMQAITLGSTALTDEEYRMAVLDGLDIVGDPKTIPDTLKMRSQVNAAAQQSAPDQGVSNGTGGGGRGQNDLRSDGISNESLRHEMALSEILEEMRGLVERFDATKGD